MGQVVRSYTDCTYHDPLTGNTWARNSKAPGRSPRRHPQRFQSPPSELCPPHLNVFISEKVLYKRPVNSGHARVMNSKAIGQQVLQLQVLGSRQRTGEAVSLPEGDSPGEEANLFSQDAAPRPAHRDTATRQPWRTAQPTGAEPVSREEQGTRARPPSPCTAQLLSGGPLWRLSPLSETDPACPSPGTCPGWPWLSSRSPSGSAQTPVPEEKPQSATVKRHRSDSHPPGPGKSAAGSRGCTISRPETEVLKRGDGRKAYRLGSLTEPSRP